ncbi:MAG: DUF72 domain-containing protein [Nitrospirota bacterium]
MNIHLGTCSWTDPTLLRSGFYPKGVNTPEDRLRYYSRREELKEWAEKIKRLSAIARIIYGMFNNCQGNKAIMNAMDLREMLLTG